MQMWTLFKQQEKNFLSYFFNLLFNVPHRIRDTYRVSTEPLSCSAPYPTWCFYVQPQPTPRTHWGEMAATVASWGEGACSWEFLRGEEAMHGGGEASKLPVHAPLSHQPSLTKFKDKIMENFKMVTFWVWGCMWLYYWYGIFSFSVEIMYLDLFDNTLFLTFGPMFITEMRKW